MLLFFLLGGVIVGETVSLTMVVTAFGPSVLGKLFLINGLLLLLLPPLFFNHIDTINRGSFLTAQFAVTAGLLCICFIFLGPLSSMFPALTGTNRIVLIIYPISYLSKTLLFLTFWTLANDLLRTDEAKKGFPIIAAWGFTGGLVGACIARMLLARFDVIVVIALWIAAYGAGFFLSKRITVYYGNALRKKEHLEHHTERTDVLSGLEGVWQNKLIRGISIMYFFVFIAVFLQDFLFWKKSSMLFATSQSLASFQFTFYLIHSIATIIGLLYVMPPLIRTRGFPRMFPALPLMLFVGSLILLGMHMTHSALVVQFGALLIVQFGRQVVFENAFSPIYQMFFTAVPPHSRGRAKTFLEGVAKPLAILAAGILIMVCGREHVAIEIIIALASAVLIFASLRIRAIYQKTLMQHIRPQDTTNVVLAQIGSRQDKKIVSLIREYAHAQSSDVRSLAVRLLGLVGTKPAYKILIDEYYAETDMIVKERIARTLGSFSPVFTQPFIEKLLFDSSVRIRANALHAVNHQQSQHKWHYYKIIRSMLFENNPRIQIEAARYLWDVGTADDKAQVNALMISLCMSKNQNHRSAGLLLVGLLKPNQWETLLMNNLTNASFQVYTKCLEVLFASAAKDVKIKTLLTVETMSRRHINAAGRILTATGMPAGDGACAYISQSSNMRMLIEVVHALRSMAVAAGDTGNLLKIDRETRVFLLNWIYKEIKHVYHDSFIWYTTFSRIDSKKRTCAEMLEDALKDEMLRLCEWTLDVMVLLDKDNMMAAVRRDFNLKDSEQRTECAEIIECGREHELASLIVPILRSEKMEDIALIGSQEFGFTEEPQFDGLRYFVESKNKWVSFCALHCAYTQKGRAATAEYLAILMIMKQDGTLHFAEAAQRMLDELYGKTTGGTMEPFALLERVLALKKTPLFRHIPAEKLMTLAETTQSATYAKGDIVSREGDVAEQLYIVRTGSLQVHKNTKGVVSHIGNVRAGEIYGEIGLFNQAPRFATATAETPCEIWILQRMVLKKFILDMPEIAYTFLEVFSEKLRRSSEELALHASRAGAGVLGKTV